MSVMRPLSVLPKSQPRLVSEFSSKQGHLFPTFRFSRFRMSLCYASYAYGYFSSKKERAFLRVIVSPLSVSSC